MAAPESLICLDRRHFLRQSACGIGLLALADLISSECPTLAGVNDSVGRRKVMPHHRPTARNVIFIFMAGGPSHLDLFDPKPVLTKLHGQPVPDSFLRGLDDVQIKAKAVAQASPRVFQRHGQCGMEFSDYLPHLGSCADDLCMVRSMYTHTSNHDPGQLVLQCGTTLPGHPSMGAWVTYGLGSESQNLPGFVVLLSNSGKGIDAGTALWSNGFMPSAYRGVTFRSQGEPILHLSNPPGVPVAAQRQRLAAINDLNRLRYEMIGDPEIESRISAYELAYRMQMAAPELLDFGTESKSTLELYGIHNDTTRWFGTNCLLARRMVERGVRFVQLYHSTWDDHSELNKNLKTNTAMTDLPAAALIKDLKQRGLLDQTLVIWGGEFGRTPMYEVRRDAGMDPAKAGRDHHPYGFTMLLAGGGVRAGAVVGQTDSLGYHAVEDRVHVHDLQATILHCLGLDHKRLTYRHLGRDFRLTDVSGNVIHKLLA